MHSVKPTSDRSNSTSQTPPASPANQAHATGAAALLVLGASAAAYYLLPKAYNAISNYLYPPPPPTLTEQIFGNVSWALEQITQNASELSLGSLAAIGFYQATGDAVQWMNSPTANEASFTNRLVALEDTNPQTAQELFDKVSALENLQTDIEEERTTKQNNSIAEDLDDRISTAVAAAKAAQIEAANREIADKTEEYRGQISDLKVDKATLDTIGQIENRLNELSVAMTAFLDVDWYREGEIDVTAFQQQLAAVARLLDEAGNKHRSLETDLITPFQRRFNELNIQSTTAREFTDKVAGLDGLRQNLEAQNNGALSGLLGEVNNALSLARQGATEAAGREIADRAAHFEGQLRTQEQSINAATLGSIEGIRETLNQLSTEIDSSFKNPLYREYDITILEACNETVRRLKQAAFDKFQELRQEVIAQKVKQWESNLRALESAPNAELGTEEVLATSPSNPLDRLSEWLREMSVFQNGMQGADLSAVGALEQRIRTLQSSLRSQAKALADQAENASPQERLEQQVTSFKDRINGVNERIASEEDLDKLALYTDTLSEIARDVEDALKNPVFQDLDRSSLEAQRDEALRIRNTGILEKKKALIKAQIDVVISEWNSTLKAADSQIQGATFATLVDLRALHVHLADKQKNIKFQEHPDCRQLLERIQKTGFQINDKINALVREEIAKRDQEFQVQVDAIETDLTKDADFQALQARIDPLRRAIQTTIDDALLKDGWMTPLTTHLKRLTEIEQAFIDIPRLLELQTSINALVKTVEQSLSTITYIRPSGDTGAEDPFSSLNEKLDAALKALPRTSGVTLNVIKTIVWPIVPMVQKAQEQVRGKEQEITSQLEKRTMFHEQTGVWNTQLVNLCDRLVRGELTQVEAQSNYEQILANATDAADTVTQDKLTAFKTKAAEKFEKATAEAATAAEEVVRLREQEEDDTRLAQSIDERVRNATTLEGLNALARAFQAERAKTAKGSVSSHLLESGLIQVRDRIQHEAMKNADIATRLSALESYLDLIDPNDPATIETLRSMLPVEVEEEEEQLGKINLNQEMEARFSALIENKIFDLSSPLKQLENRVAELIEANDLDALRDLERQINPLYLLSGDGTPAKAIYRRVLEQINDVLPEKSASESGFSSSAQTFANLEETLKDFEQRATVACHNRDYPKVVAILDQLRASYEIDPLEKVRYENVQRTFGKDLSGIERSQPDKISKKADEEDAMMMALIENTIHAIRKMLPPDSERKARETASFEARVASWRESLSTLDSMDELALLETSVVKHSEFLSSIRAYMTQHGDSTNLQAQAQYRALAHQIDELALLQNEIKEKREVLLKGGADAPVSGTEMPPDIVAATGPLHFTLAEEALGRNKLQELKDLERGWQLKQDAFGPHLNDEMKNKIAALLDRIGSAIVALDPAAVHVERTGSAVATPPWAQEVFAFERCLSGLRDRWVRSNERAGVLKDELIKAYNVEGWKAKVAAATGDEQTAYAEMLRKLEGNIRMFEMAQQEEETRATERQDSMAQLFATSTFTIDAQREIVKEMGAPDVTVEKLEELEERLNKLLSEDPEHHPNDDASLVGIISADIRNATTNELLHEVHLKKLELDSSLSNDERRRAIRDAKLKHIRDQIPKGINLENLEAALVDLFPQSAARTDTSLQFGRRVMSGLGQVQQQREENFKKDLAYIQQELTAETPDLGSLLEFASELAQREDIPKELLDEAQGLAAQIETKMGHQQPKPSLDTLKLTESDKPGPATLPRSPAAPDLTKLAVGVDSPKHLPAALRKAARIKDESSDEGDLDTHKTQPVRATSGSRSEPPTPVARGASGHSRSAPHTPTQRPGSASPTPAAPPTKPNEGSRVKHLWDVSKK